MSVRNIGVKNLEELLNENKIGSNFTKWECLKDKNIVDWFRTRNNRHKMTMIKTIKEWCENANTQPQTRMCTIVIKQSVCKQLSWRCFFFAFQRIFVGFFLCFLVRLSPVSLCKIVRGFILCALMLEPSTVRLLSFYSILLWVGRIESECKMLQWWSSLNGTQFFWTNA